MKMVFFDLETAGLQPQHPIIQVAAVAVDTATWEELEVYEQKLTFDHAAADSVALKLNHWDKDTWADEGVHPYDACRDFSAFLWRHLAVNLVSKKTGLQYTVAQLAGYNVVTFDGPRLTAWFKEWNSFLPASPKILDVYQLAMWYVRIAKLDLPNEQLATVCAYLGIDHDAHDALGDVTATVKLAQKLSGWITQTEMVRENDVVDRAAIQTK